MTYCKLCGGKMKKSYSKQKFCNQICFNIWRSILAYCKDLSLWNIVEVGRDKDEK